jgi:hypothetical protein
MTARRILFFCPEGLLHPHLIIMGYTARTMMALGHESILAVCDASLERCVPKNARGVPPGLGRAATMTLCQDCSRNVRTIGTAYEVPQLELAPYYTAGLEGEIWRLIDGCGDRPESFELDGVKLGQLALADLRMTLKLMPETPLNPDSVQRLREATHTAACTHVVIGHLIKVGGITDLVVFNHYAPNAAAMLAGWRGGINVRVLGNTSLNGTDRRHIAVMRAGGFQAAERFAAFWPAWRDRPLSAEEVERQGTDLQHRLGGVTVHVYSPRKTNDSDVMAALDLPRDRRLIVAYTSSPDENSACEARETGLRGQPFRLPHGHVFRDQAAWLSASIALMRRRPDLSLVVRIHPREDANRRDGVRSQHLEQVMAALADPPANVRVIEPRMAVSSYDLLEVADLAMVSWSSIGIEAANMGVPVLAVMQEQVPLPAADFLIEPTGPGDFDAAIDRALTQPCSLERITRAYRWFYQSRMANTVSFADVLPTREFEGVPAFSLTRNAELFGAVMLGDRLPEEIRQAEPLDDLPRRLLAERQAVLRQLRALIRFVMVGEGGENDTTWRFGDHPEPGGAALAVAEGWCSWRDATRDIRRYSRLVARLAPLVAAGG